MMTKTSAILSVVILAITLVNQYSCSTLVSTPTIKKVKNVGVTEFNNESLKLKLTAEIQNDNSSEINLKKLYLIILSKNDTIGYAQKDSAIKLIADSLNDVQLDVTLISEKILDHLMNNNDVVEFTLAGKLYAKMGSISIPVNVDIPFSFNVKDEITKAIENDSKKNEVITIEETYLEKVGVSESSVKVNFILKNLYGIDIKVIGYPSEIYINGKYAGKGDITDSLSLTSEQNEMSGEMLFNVNNFQSITSLVASVFNGKLEYQTKGILHLEIMNRRIQFPYSFNGVLVQL